MDKSSVYDNLPSGFLRRMQEMLGEEYDSFLQSFGMPRQYGLRINTAKITCEEFERIVPFSVRPIPWIHGGYFYDEEVRPSQCPLYQAGLYYLQEPSAMTPAALLPVSPGDRVLDLCAAPGGKATALGAKLCGNGLLIANDISTSRAKALLRNIELFGVTSGIVCDEKPDRLAERFPAFFDRILLDAPCSGEGMFRKDEALSRDWTPEKSAALSSTQKELILLAADMLRPGGYLLYSTCTFAPCEDEEVIAFLLAERPDMQLQPAAESDGFAPGFPRYGNDDPAMTRCVRLFPHRIAGEGHFMALLHKEGTALLSGEKPRSGKSGRKARISSEEKQNLSYILSFLESIGVHTLSGLPFDPSRVRIQGEKAFYLPQVQPSFEGLSYLRYGLFLGELKKNRFEPSQPLALALQKSEADAVISLSSDDPRLSSYLKGESIPIEPSEAASSKGWHLLAVSGYPLAFGKLVNGVLKNHYPSGWRIP